MNMNSAPLNHGSGRPGGDPALPPFFAAGEIMPPHAGRSGSRFRLWTIACLCLLAGAAAFAAYQYYRAAEAAASMAAEGAAQERLQGELAREGKDAAALPMAEWEARSLFDRKQYLLETEQETRKQYKESISAYAAPERQLERKDLLDRREAMKKEIEELKRD